jgi:hypothetical protein
MVKRFVIIGMVFVALTACAGKGKGIIDESEIVLLTKPEAIVHEPQIRAGKNNSGGEKDIVKTVPIMTYLVHGTWRPFSGTEQSIVEVDDLREQQIEEKNGRNRDPKQH